MDIYIGAEHIISPLGKTAETNFDAMRQDRIGIKKVQVKGIGESVYLSAFDASEKFTFDILLKNCLNSIRELISEDIFLSDKTLLILSTTKGDIEHLSHDVIGRSIAEIQNWFAFKNMPLVVSNACTSGVIAINTAANLIRAKIYDHVIVLGCDIVSEFVVKGFQSLFAISKTACTPFDANRSGITLGEACAGLVLSNKQNLFKQTPVRFIEGTSSNDANHISGPSRTGEGLYLTVKKTMDLARMDHEDIDFISAHGTATVYNDDMESVAFNRLQMQNIPLNSFKGYIGHTLGAAGIIETALCIQCMRNNTLLKSYGFEKHGTAEKVNVIAQHQQTKVNTILKTSSGFGGSNGSLILQKI